MKRKLLTFALALSGILLLNGCYTYSDDYITDYEVRQLIEQALREHEKDMPFTNWKIVDIPVNADQWDWAYIDGHPDKGNWQVIFEFPELTEFIYNEGAALGYIFLGEQNKNEIQKPLPYVQTDYDIDFDSFYTTTISCDFQIDGGSTVAFYIESSDLVQDQNVATNYNFRIVLIW